MPEMEIRIYDDGETSPSGIWTVLLDAEKELAEEEGRAPIGWYWMEGMPEPKAIPFDDEDYAEC